HGTREARKILRNRANQLAGLLPDERRGFETGSGIDLRTEAGLGRSYEDSTVAYKLYERSAVPSDDEIAADLDVVLEAYDSYMSSHLRREFHDGEPPELPPSEGGGPKPNASFASSNLAAFSLAEATADVAATLASRGFTYEPWQIAQYISA